MGKQITGDGIGGRLAASVARLCHRFAGVRLDIDNLDKAQVLAQIYLAEHGGQL